MKDVQCYELFGGIALKNHAFLNFLNFIFNAKSKAMLEKINKRYIDKQH